MKKIIFALTAPLVLFLCGCPVGLKFSPGKPGTEKIDKGLIGRWSTDAEDPEFRIAEVTRKDDFSFQVKVSETGTMYALEEFEFTGWNTVIDGQSFFYIKSSEDFYTYGYKLEDNQLTLYSAALLDGGLDAVTSTETFRKQLALSIKRPEWYTEPLVFTKE